MARRLPIVSDFPDRRESEMTIAIDDVPVSDSAGLIDVNLNEQTRTEKKTPRLSCDGLIDKYPNWGISIFYYNLNYVVLVSMQMQEGAIERQDQIEKPSKTPE